MNFPGSITSKLPRFGSSIFATMSALANEHGAINLSQGFPDFSPHSSLAKLMAKAIENGHNQYAPMPGIMPLREAISLKTEKLYSLKYDPETEITVTPGATAAIFTAVMSVLREGDEVIIIEPAYDCYLPAVELTGAKAVFASLKYPEFRINWDEIRKLINFKTRMIMINTPHNPTGSVLSSADLAMLEKLTNDTNIVVVSDEVYEHIIFDGVEHQSVARFPKLAARSFIISSFGKTYHTTGWKTGYVLAPLELTREFRKVHQFMVFSTHTPSQHVFVELLKDSSLYLELGSFYQEKRDYFAKLLKGSKFKLLPCQGSYFQSLNYEKISTEPDTEMAVRLIKEYGVASIPVSVFYNKKRDDHVLRLCFAKNNETLERAAEKLQKVK